MFLQAAQAGKSDFDEKMELYKIKRRFSKSAKFERLVTDGDDNLIELEPQETCILAHLMFYY